MTDKPNNNGRMLTENEMDRLLESFYKTEVPPALDSLPSSWPQLQQGTTGSLTKPAAAHESATTPTARRGIAVAAATLAACLTLVFVNSMTTDDGGAEVAKPAVAPLAQPAHRTEETINVSGGGDKTGAVDDVNTNLIELDNIDLTPQKLPMPE